MPKEKKNARGRAAARPSPLSVRVTRSAAKLLQQRGTSIVEPQSSEGEAVGTTAKSVPIVGAKVKLSQKSNVSQEACVSQSETAQAASTSEPLQKEDAIESEPVQISSGEDVEQIEAAQAVAPVRRFKRRHAIKPQPVIYCYKDSEDEDENEEEKQEEQEEVQQPSSSLHEADVSSGAPINGDN